MKNNWKRGIACFLVLALVAVLCLGCGGDSSEGKVVITIGQITDLTGVSSPALVPINAVVQDIARYYNDEGLIPGVEIKIATYNQAGDQAKQIPGYEWVKERGASIIITVLPTTGEALKRFATDDKIPITSLSTTTPMIEPPGWLFAFSCPATPELHTTMKWVSENRWDYSQGVPKIGSVAWSASIQMEVRQALKEYCQNHPDQYEWVGGFLVPMGTMTWSGEVEKLKECDFIVPGPIAFEAAGFIKEFYDKGYTTTYVGSSSQLAVRGFLLDKCGWDAVDRMLCDGVSAWWNSAAPIVDLAKDILYRYRSGEAEDLIYAGSSYVGAFVQTYAIFEILKNAIEEVGIENFDSQAYYDAALKYKVTWEGYPAWSFSETKRYLVDYVDMYEWQREADDLVRVSDWIPIVVE